MKETSGSESLTMHRNTADDLKTGVTPMRRDEHGGDLLTGHVMSGVEEA